MIAAFMFGTVTRKNRWRTVAPSTLAASCSSSGTWDRPASSSSEMNGVVFHTSAMMITNSADHRDNRGGGEDRRPDDAPPDQDPVHDQGEGEADDQLDRHGHDRDEHRREHRLPPQAVG